MISLEELLNAPLLPNNLPSFEIIKECQKVENVKEARNESESESEIEEVFPCECGYDEHLTNFEGQACGPTANCINRELFIECNREECPCRNRCQNQRFQKRKYSQVKVIQTPGKGFGLFTCEDLKVGTFIMEYVGEIVDQDQMGKRAERYFKQGQSHFYFMTLRPNQIIDATSKGNLSRFMNHSCSPNCETQKWIVGGKIKIGLFALRNIKAGTELTFDYKFVRFGKEAQKCLCGELNCTGFIGVSSEDIKYKKRTTNSSVELNEFEAFMEMNPKSAELPGQISLVVSKLIQTNDLILIKKLLKILQSTQKYLCKRKFLNLHGLKLLSTLFTENSKDPEVILTILNILNELPLNYRNLIDDSGWTGKLKKIHQEWQENAEIIDLVDELDGKWNNLPSNGVSRNFDNNSSFNNSEIDNTIPVLMSVPSEFSSALQRKRQQWKFDEEFPLSTATRTTASRSRNEFKSPRRSSPEPSRSSSPNKIAKVIPDPMWLSAKAPDGRDYYYHSMTRETSWEIPMILEPFDKMEHVRDRETSKSYNRDRGQDSRDNKDSKGYDPKARNLDYRERNFDRRGRINDTRDSRERGYDYREKGHEYREKDYDTRDSRRDSDFRDSRGSSGRDYDSRIYKDKIEFKSNSSHSHSDSIQSSYNTSSNSALLEGVGDSSQLSAIIERAKARRTQEQEEIMNNNEVIINPDISSSPPPASTSTNGIKKRNYSKLKEEISSIVIRFFSHYRKDLGDEFKELARKYTHKIIEKELKETNSNLVDDVLTSRKRQKIKVYLAEVLKGRRIKLSSEHESILEKSSKRDDNK